MTRKVTAEQLREIVRSRRTKGMAFLLKGEAYEAEQTKVGAELSGMSGDEIMAKWPECTYDLRLKGL